MWVRPELSCPVRVLPFSTSDEIIVQGSWPAILRLHSRHQNRLQTASSSFKPHLTFLWLKHSWTFSLHPACLATHRFLWWSSWFFCSLSFRWTGPCSLPFCDPFLFLLPTRPRSGRSSCHQVPSSLTFLQSHPHVISPFLQAPWSPWAFAPRSLYPSQSFLALSGKLLANADSEARFVFEAVALNVLSQRVRFHRRSRQLTCLSQQRSCRCSQPFVSCFPPILESTC